MAYALKFTTYKEYPNGDKYTLNIYQKDYSGSPLEIAVLTGFALQVQGDQSALTAPIIKTSVNISLKDTLVENAQGQMVSELGGKKYGQWEEFYTNDPVKYRVDVAYSGGLTRNATIWSGYLTPDSWGEEMVYGGDISLTARDMLGYLDEQEFDLTGRVTIQSLIEAAITKSKASMSSVSFKAAECLYNSNNQSILAATIGASTYSGNTWYQALEKVLESLGLVLRYDGNGGWLVTSLRYLASHTHETHTPCFTGRSGYRTLDPAVKQIVETFDPKWENFDVPDAEESNVSQASGTWTCEYHWVTTRTASVQKYQITGDANWNGYAASLPNRTPYKNALNRNIYIPVNTTTDVGLVFRRTGFLPPCRVVLGISAPHHATASTIINDGDNINPAATRSIEAIISVIVGGTTYYLNSEYRWDSQSSHTIEITPDAASIEIPAIGGGSASDFRITFNKANMDDYVGAVSAPFYVAVDVQFQPLDGASEIAGEYKTTTIYNENNHNEITRTPSIGAASGSANIDFINNLLAYGNGFATDAWKFSGDANAFPLAVMIHAQLLVYNGQMEDSQGNTTGNSIFTGNLHDYTRVPAAPCTKYTYFGRNCVLLSGAYNLLTGEVDSVTLREVFGWSDVWDTFNPSYSVKTSKNEGGTSSAGGSGGSSSGGGGTGSVTSVDVSVPTGLIATGNPITSRGTIAIAYDPNYSGNPHNTTFEQLQSKPTTLQGYGITGGYVTGDLDVRHDILRVGNGVYGTGGVAAEIQLDGLRDGSSYRLGKIKYYAYSNSEFRKIEFARSEAGTDYTLAYIDDDGGILAYGEVTAGSDARFKDNISDLRDFKAILRALRPCEWDWKEGHGNGHSAGFIAQEVAEIMPYAVKGNEEEGYTLNYNVFSAFAVKALQEQEVEIKALKDEVAKLKEMVK